VIEISQLPTVNAGLNAASAVLLCVGYIFIRRRQVRAHKTCMIAAFLTSTCFLTCYLIYHAHVLHVPYPGSGWDRVVYLSILFSHVVLAIMIIPLSLVTLYRAFRGQFDRHRRIARWTLPMWIYVSVTGVVVYWMLYRMPH
jgi:putative membrane protein